eukprot:2523371-Prymnesium_polylepis.1
MVAWKGALVAARWALVAAAVEPAGAVAAATRRRMERADTHLSTAGHTRQKSGFACSTLPLTLAELAGGRKHLAAVSGAANVEGEATGGTRSPWTLRAERLQTNEADAALTTGITGAAQGRMWRGWRRRSRWWRHLRRR